MHSFPPVSLERPWHAKATRLALIRSRFSVLTGRKAVFAVNPAVETFRPIPAARHAATCGGIKFRSVPAAPADAPFEGLAPDVPNYVSDWRPVSSLPPSIQAWIGNGFSIGAPIANLP